MLLEVLMNSYAHANRVLRAFAKRPDWTAAAFVLSGMLSAPCVSAHPEEMLDAMKAPHGGIIRMAGPYHIELVLPPAKPPSQMIMVLYLQDHAFKDVSTAGLTGLAQLKGSTELSLKLVPSGRNRLSAEFTRASDSYSEVEVTITAADGQSYSARFNPWKTSSKSR